MAFSTTDEGVPVLDICTLWGKVMGLHRCCEFPLEKDFGKHVF